jgi:hypothetical protein
VIGKINDAHAAMIQPNPAISNALFRNLDRDVKDCEWTPRRCRGQELLSNTPIADSPAHIVALLNDAPFYAWAISLVFLALHVTWSTLRTLSIVFLISWARRTWPMQRWLQIFVPHRLKILWEEGGLIADLEQVLSELSQQKVLCIGDLMLDEFVYGWGFPHFAGSAGSGPGDQS